MSKIKEVLAKMINTTNVDQVLRVIGEDLSEILNQTIYQKSDNEVVDEITTYLKELNIYKERK